MTDYKDTVSLPRTEFAMRAKLPELEPRLLQRWDEIELFQRLRTASKGRPKFILHDGPPYANGNIHIGTALNKILKDVINRSQQMLGKDANYVPGWDCHGLPIEWKIEEQHRAAGRDKDDIPVTEFRAECRAFAAHWIDVQREEFKRLGVVGDWQNPYTTMSRDAEAHIVRELHRFAMNGLLYRGSKPVMWSVVEKTALAEAEVEYHDAVSDQIWVKFPVLDPTGPLEGAAVVVWTTTPWTIPGNRAVCFSPHIGYGLYEVIQAPDGNWAKPGDRLILADDLAADVFKAAKVDGYNRVGPVDLAAGWRCAHPLRESGLGGYGFDVPLLAGEHVTDDAGTGFVHTAPGHGREDFEVWTANARELAARGIETAIPYAVDENGAFTADAPGFTGKRVLTDAGEKGDANEAVIAALIKAGMLVARGRLTHQYPHSWRSKKPVIFRNTPQWFIAMDGDIDRPGDTLRARALAAIRATRWVPPQGENRITGMIQSRPDWVISRQRAWGVPIAVFVKDGEVLRDEAVNARIVAAFEAEGADAWFSSDPARFLGPDHDPADCEQVTDILDVWFDSGATHGFVLEPRDDLEWPASLYLEGSDQHRGWFQSSLLESCGTRGRAPYEAVLTHGFVLAEAGVKMSKSLGNALAPQDIAETHGAEILRIWVVASDYSEDLKIGPEILAHQVDAYRRLRNTFRFILGNLAGFDAAERLPPAEMPELERFVLNRLHELDRLVRDCSESFDFHQIFTALHQFCTVDLSAFYFDIRKDALYCDRDDATARRAARTVLDHLFDCLTAWLSPIICFTTEEAWLARNPDSGISVHERLFPEIPAGWRAPELAERWEQVRAVRRVITGALEIERAEKRIGASLQARPVLHLPAEHRAALDGLDMAEIAITSGLDIVEGPPPPGAYTLPELPGVGVTVAPAEGAKCERCYKVLEEVGTVAGYETICRRCADAVAHTRQAAE